MNDRADPSVDLAALGDALPQLTPQQWTEVGAGAALALVGSGLVSFGTVLRLAAVAGGGLLAYRAWKGASTGIGIGGTTTGDMDRTMAEGAGGASATTVGSRLGVSGGLPTGGSVASGASTTASAAASGLPETPPADGPSSLAEADHLPGVDMRGA